MRFRKVPPAELDCHLQLDCQPQLEHAHSGSCLWHGQGFPRLLNLRKSVCSGCETSTFQVEGSVGELGVQRMEI